MGNEIIRLLCLSVCLSSPVSTKNVKHREDKSNLAWMIYQWTSSVTPRKRREEKEEKRKRQFWARIDLIYWSVWWWNKIKFQSIRFSRRSSFHSIYRQKQQQQSFLMSLCVCVCACPWSTIRNIFDFFLRFLTDWSVMIADRLMNDETWNQIEQGSRE